ncbi:DUF4111 domain-containing protein [Archangium violaceum]|uniref:aminoglycoside adenylyltransferase domain-containing protein n=1 Tax=Archangium violaceum TaxID=83451 RepID=UPI00194E918A|nr:aminoglycoside adenylyltransferase domain-containing protein [Archangium violaceum]QRO00598.1 DUF4111 domain-containing protein [Archangium violaceum]
MSHTQEPEVHVAPEVARYAGEVASRLRALLGDELLGAYLIGSGSLGGYEPGRSDIDIIAICAHRQEVRVKQAIAEALDHRVLACPARGLEFVLYPKDAVATPTRSPRFEMNFNTGAHMNYRLGFDPADEAAHWFVIDLDIARGHAVPLVGPPASELLAAAPRAWVLDAVRDSLTWHAREEPVSPNNVLNACRAWRYAEECVWGTKVAGATWARARLADPSLIEAAIAKRNGQPGPALEQDAVRALVQRVLDAVERASRRSHP